MSDEPLPLFAHARRSDPLTSHEAAASVTRRSMTVSQALVLMVLRELGDATNPEIEAAARKRGSVTPGSRLRTARRELADVGMVEETGEKRPHPETGRRCAGWRVKE